MAQLRGTTAITILETRLRDADSVLASLEIRQMSGVASALAAELKEVLERGISEENAEEAQELLGRYRALTIG